MEKRHVDYDNMAKESQAGAIFDVKDDWKIDLGGHKI